MKDFYDDISRFTTSIIMSILYGHRTPRYARTEAEEFVKLQLDFMYIVDLGKAPPVDIFPSLRFIPERIAKWKRDALNIKARQENLFGRLTNMAIQRVLSSNGNGSFMEEAFSNMKNWGLSDSLLR